MKFLSKKYSNNKNLKKYFLLFMYINFNPIFLVRNTSMAFESSKEGFSVLKQNIENSEKNLDAYEKNLQIVESNQNEIKKSKIEFDERKSDFSKIQKEHLSFQKKWDQQGKELLSSMAQEEQRKTSDIKKRDELKKALEVLDLQLQKRDELISEYKNHKIKYDEESKTLKQRSEEILKIQKDLQTQAQKISAEESEWNSKQKGYLIEKDRWKKEIEKQKELLRQFEQLKNSEN